MDCNNITHIIVNIIGIKNHFLSWSQIEDMITLRLTSLAITELIPTQPSPSNVWVVDYPEHKPVLRVYQVQRLHWDLAQSRIRGWLMHAVPGKSQASLTLDARAPAPHTLPCYCQLSVTAVDNIRSLVAHWPRPEKPKSTYRVGIVVYGYYVHL